MFGHKSLLRAMDEARPMLYVCFQFSQCCTHFTDGQTEALSHDCARSHSHRYVAEPDPHPQSVRPSVGSACPQEGQIHTMEELRGPRAATSTRRQVMAR